jgi:hypothetical protein
VFDQSIATENGRQEARPLLGRTPQADTLTATPGEEAPLSLGHEMTLRAHETLKKILEAMALASRRGGQEGR